MTHSRLMPGWMTIPAFMRASALGGLVGRFLPRLGLVRRPGETSRLARGSECEAGRTLHTFGTMAGAGRVRNGGFRFEIKEKRTFDPQARLNAQGRFLYSGLCWD